MIEAKNAVVWTNIETRQVDVENVEGKSNWIDSHKGWRDPIGASYLEWGEMKDEQHVELMLETAIDLAMNGFDLAHVLKEFSKVRQFRALGSKSFPMCRALTKAMLGQTLEPNTMTFEELLINYKPVDAPEPLSS
jgi:hypothetical protein